MAGVVTLCAGVRRAAEDVLAAYSLKQELTCEGLEQLIRDIQQSTCLGGERSKVVISLLCVLMSVWCLQVSSVFPGAVLSATGEPPRSGRLCTLLHTAHLKHVHPSSQSVGQTSVLLSGISLRGGLTTQCVHTTYHSI